MKPIFVQPLTAQTKFLPEAFNRNEYDTLAALNVPFNSTGTIPPVSTATIPLGYRILIPSGCIGVMKERKSFVERCPFQVLAGVLDCNTMQEDTKCKRVIETMELFDIHEKTRLHPETTLTIHNCGTTPLEYKEGECWVQLFLVPICEAHVQTIPHDATHHTLPPLRYDHAVTTKSESSLLSMFWPASK